VIRCEQCGGEARRIPEVGDVWLDAGIVPFATLGWQSPEWIRGGYATGASRELSDADLPDHAYWEQWFPADWVVEMREQIRLWFYSLLFMAVVLDGRAPFRKVLGHEDVRDEHGHEMHGSKGNTIDAHDALEHMGADVMRWMYCAQAPAQSVRFGYAVAGEIKGKLLRLWNSVKFLLDYANIEDFRPSYQDLEHGPGGEQRALDRWLVARTQQLLRETEDAYERFWTPAIVDAFERFVDELSNWYIRRSRRRFYSYDESAFRALWYALAQAVRVIAPVMPFLAERLWRDLVADACEDAPRSVFLAPWPLVSAALGDQRLLDEIAEVRRVVDLGRQARGDAGVKNRQPLRRVYVRGAPLAKAHADEIAEELRVKQVGFDEGPVVTVRLLPNLPRLGPRLGAKVPEIREALERGDFEELGGGRLRVAGEELEPDDVIRGERVELEGWAIAENGGISIALDTALDPELELEGRVLDLIHRINSMRRDAGLELTDRIVVTLPPTESDLLRYGDWIKEEVLAVSIETDGETSEPTIAKA
jgi:isoleucyl-tRNA synthetase